MLLNPEKYNIVKTEEIETLLARFDRYIDGLKTYGTVSEGRAKIYKIVWDKLSRYLIIFKKSHYTPDRFTPEDILAFREFVINEYKYVDKHKAIYGSLQKISIPTKQASINTASAKLRALQAFFNELEENDEILKSPFRRLTKKRRNEALREQYDDPFFLRLGGSSADNGSGCTRQPEGNQRCFSSSVRSRLSYRRFHEVIDVERGCYR